MNSYTFEINIVINVDAVDAVEAREFAARKLAMSLGPYGTSGFLNLQQKFERVDGVVAKIIDR